MASTLYSDDCTPYSGIQPRAGIGFCTASATYTFLAALVINDVIQMVKIPAGAVILDWILDIPASGFDTGTAVVWGLGDGDTPGRFATACVQGRSSAGAIVRPSSTGSVPGSTQYQYAAEDTIDLKVTTGPTTGVASGTLKLTVFYTFDV
jgi:hypothetical protein